jgi:hypothetical protein
MNIGNYQEYLKIKTEQSKVIKTKPIYIKYGIEFSRFDLIECVKNLIIAFFVFGGLILFYHYA